MNYKHKYHEELVLAEIVKHEEMYYDKVELSKKVGLKPGETGRAVKRLCEQGRVEMTVFPRDKVCKIRRIYESK